MSKPNKVNPGTYTQRGRLTPDDAARELRKQSAIGSPHTWQPVNTKTRPRLTPAGDAARDTERSANGERRETSPQIETRPASHAKHMTATKAAPSTARAKAAKARTARTRKSKRTTGHGKTARTVGGGRAAPRPTTKRRKR